MIVKIINLVLLVIVVLAQVKEPCIRYGRIFGDPSPETQTDIQTFEKYPNAKITQLKFFFEGVAVLQATYGNVYSKKIVKGVQHGFQKESSATTSIRNKAFKYFRLSNRNNKDAYLGRLIAFQGDDKTIKAIGVTEYPKKEVYMLWLRDIKGGATSKRRRDGGPKVPRIYPFFKKTIKKLEKNPFKAGLFNYNLNFELDCVKEQAQLVGFVSTTDKQTGIMRSLQGIYRSSDQITCNSCLEPQPETSAGSTVNKFVKSFNLSGDFVIMVLIIVAASVCLIMCLITLCEVCCNGSHVKHAAPIKNYKDAIVSIENMLAQTEHDILHASELRSSAKKTNMIHPQENFDNDAKGYMSGSMSGNNSHRRNISDRDKEFRSTNAKNSPLPMNSPSVVSPKGQSSAEGRFARRKRKEEVRESTRPDELQEIDAVHLSS